MLKRVSYPTASPMYTGEVVYIIFKGKIIFSGTTRPGSTINLTEEVITSISKKEGLDFIKYRWFDLQTHLGYRSKPPGTFDFDELVIGVQEKIDVPDDVIILYEPGAVRVKSWIPTSCPEKVIKIFKEYIGQPEASLKIWTPDEAKEAGYIPGDMSSPNTGPCFEFIKLQDHSVELSRQLPVRLQVVAQKFFGDVTETGIVVDHKGYPEYIEISNGYRYCVWIRNKAQDN